MFVKLIIPAAGVGRRFNSKLPKQFHKIDGQVMIIKTIQNFIDFEELDQIAIAVDLRWRKFLEEEISKINYKQKILIVQGGKFRQDSVYNALKKINPNSDDIILIHDAVRPYVTKKLISEVIENTKKFGAVIPGLTPKETIKVVTNTGFVSKTIPRENLISVQTPQGFKAELLIEAYEYAMKNKIYATDDSAILEFYGYKVKCIEGEETNIKITYPVDFRKSETID